MFVEASVPGRVNLFGNPLDIYGGLVMSSSVALRATVRARPAEALTFALGGRAFAVRGPDDLALRNDAFDFLRALVRSVPKMADCRIEVTTEIPVRSGLAGSAALMVAASACLLKLAGRPSSLNDILRTAHKAEVEALGNFCGWNDFYACSLGGVNSFNYRTEVDCTPDISPLVLPDGDVSFAIALTGNMHVSGSVNSNLWARWQSGDAVVRAAYGKLAELGRPARDAFARKDWPAFGRLMLENFMCQHRLGAANEIEHRLVHKAMDLGALGAKLCGAGHCGSIVVLARDDDHDKIHRGLESVGGQRYFKVEPTEGLATTHS